MEKSEFRRATIDLFFFAVEGNKKGGLFASDINSTSAHTKAGIQKCTMVFVEVVVFLRGRAWGNRTSNAMIP